LVTANGMNAKDEHEWNYLPGPLLAEWKRRMSAMKLVVLS
jgi:hypothetical protein